MSSDQTSSAEAHSKHQKKADVEEAVTAELESKKRSSKMPTTTQPAGPKRRRSTTPTTLTSQYDLWKDFCERGSAVFQQTQKQIEVMKRNDVSTMECREARLEELLQKTGNVERTLQAHHEFVEANVRAVTVEALRKTLKGFKPGNEELAKEIHESVEAAKQAMVIRIEEVDQEVRNARSDIHKISYQTLLMELRQRDQQFNEFRNEVNMKLQTIEKKMEILPDILSMLKGLKTGVEASPEKWTDEDFFKIDDDPEYEPQQTTPSLVAAEVNPQDDKSIRDAIRANQIELTKVSHAIFSITHKIEEAHKAGEASPERRRKTDALKKEKYQLIDEEMKYKQKVRELKLMLNDWTKAPRRTQKDTSPRQRRRDTPPSSSHRSPRRSRMDTSSRSSHESARKDRHASRPSSRSSPRRIHQSSHESPPKHK